MLIGVPKEVKLHEYRVGLIPDGVAALIEQGHQVVVQQGAGAPIGYGDADYIAAGAQIVEDARAVYRADLVIKVKEPIAEEYDLLHPKQLLFCFLHLAANRSLIEALIERQTIAIAYETVTSPQGRLPLLLPMSQLAGKIAVQSGAVTLQMENGGRGVLLGGVPGVQPARVLVLGGGVVGGEAARIAYGLGADVTVFDRNVNRLHELQGVIGTQLKTCYATTQSIARELPRADLVIGAVLLPGKHAPRLLTHSMMQTMPQGSVFVDVSIDQGGCAQTSRPTDLTNPTYIDEGVVHYCVTNMPGACARTATEALCHATLPYILRLATQGYTTAFAEDAHFARGLNIANGKIMHPGVAEAFR